MTTDLTTTQPGTEPTASAPRSLGSIVPGVAAVLFAGVQLQAGVVTVAFRQISAVPADRLNFPYEGSMSVAMSLAWALAQAGFVLSLIAFARCGATGRSRMGRLGSGVLIVGGAVFVAAQAASAFMPDARSDEPAAGVVVMLFAVGSLLTAFGFAVAGVAVLRARVWSSWRRFTPVSVGAAMLCLVPLQFTSLLAVGVTLYAATILGFGAALLAEPPDDPA
jgi:hypothetical protein